MQKLSASQRAARVPIQFTIGEDSVAKHRAAIAREIVAARDDAFDECLRVVKGGISELAKEFPESVIGRVFSESPLDLVPKIEALKSTGAVEASTACTTERSPSEVAEAAPVPRRVQPRHLEEQLNHAIM